MAKVLVNEKQNRFTSSRKGLFKYCCAKGSHSGDSSLGHEEGLII